MDASLMNARTVALVTFRKDGTEVSTPVSAVAIDGKLCAISVTPTWKVKRIANNPRVKVAPCTLSGKPLGLFHDGTAQVVTGTVAIDRVRTALRARYGWIAGFANWLGRLRRSDAHRAVIEVTIP